MFYTIIQILFILIFLARLISLFFFHFKKYSPKIMWFLTNVPLEEYDIKKFSPETLIKLKTVFTIETFFVVGGSNIILFYFYNLNSDMRLLFALFLAISNSFFSKWINKILVFEKVSYH